ncbi:hypothetical protein F5B21DRAFT_464415 [Xylaria acuta]|nr:hypothetical protein F5B21DRAFT_464415 [Xylaria acuta]
MIFVAEHFTCDTTKLLPHPTCLTPSFIMVYFVTSFLEHPHLPKIPIITSHKGDWSRLL